MSETAQLNINEFSVSHYEEQYGTSRNYEVLDDNGNAFLLVQVDTGYCGFMCAKKAREGEDWDSMKLSKEERDRLDISDEQWEDTIEW